MLVFLSALFAIFLFVVVFSVPILAAKSVYDEVKKPYEYDEYFRIIDSQTGKPQAATKGYLRSHNLTLEQYEAEFVKTHEIRNPTSPYYLKKLEEEKVSKQQNI